MAALKPAGFKLSLAGKKNDKTAKFSAATLTERPRSALDEEEPEDTNKSVEISGWDALNGGAVDLSTKKEGVSLPTIQSLPNRNWRDEARRIKGAKQNGVQNINVGKGNSEKYKESNIAYGLTVVDKTQSTSSRSASLDVNMREPEEKDEDTLAREALLAEARGERKQDDDLVIYSEAQAFKDGYAEAPDAPDEAAYERVKIEDFGRALLRGMGWKDGDEVGRNRSSAPAKPRKVERRAALLGIGAKEEAAAGIELGEWGKGAKGKRKVDQAYNPVALRNKETGEILTEEELKAKMEQQQLLQEDNRTEQRRKRSPDSRNDYRSERSSRRHKHDYDEDDRDHRLRKDHESEKYRDNKYRERDRDRNRDRARDKDRGRHRDKDRDRDCEYDSRHRSSRRDRRERSTSSDERRKRKRRDYDDDRDRLSRRGDRDRDREKYESPSRRRREEVY
ncbi:hypothetical protein K469DRAFT_742861 [Zopfia rhizophila CBS 207.26]|uniref:Pre-mRNA-splicing factor n=1 Tax=Zopfia rhizophila CBS 207.26 TaxID=1314779 RepID=A0A6A6DE25_9PEZI|nr:hypothetical protein K469DRAFT_742861 [Zopfia rhizophila CBS 207.26]